MMQWDEIEELACLLLGLDYDSIVNSNEEYIIEDKFYNKFNIDLEDFEYLIKKLIKFTPTWKSPLTGQLYQGFVTPENEKLMRAIIKREYEVPKV